MEDWALSSPQSRGPLIRAAVLRLPPPALRGFSPMPTRCQAGGGHTGSGRPTLLTHLSKSQGGHPSEEPGQEECLHLVQKLPPNTPTVRLVRWQKVGHC